MDGQKDKKNEKIDGWPKIIIKQMDGWLDGQKKIYEKNGWLDG